jgi:hypothetical protein
MSNKLKVAAIASALVFSASAASAQIQEIFALGDVTNCQQTTTFVKFSLVNQPRVIDFNCTFRNGLLVTGTAVGTAYHYPNINSDRVVVTNMTATGVGTLPFFASHDYGTWFGAGGFAAAVFGNYTAASPTFVASASDLAADSSFSNNPIGVSAARLNTGVLQGGVVKAGNFSGRGTYSMNLSWNAGGGTIVFPNSWDFKLGLGTITGVPEPSAWATMILGLGLIGAALRRRARTARA